MLLRTGRQTGSGFRVAATKYQRRIELCDAYEI